MTVPAPTPRLDAETSAYLAEMGAQLAQLTDEDEAALLAATALAEASLPATSTVLVHMQGGVHTWCSKSTDRGCSKMAPVPSVSSWVLHRGKRLAALLKTVYLHSSCRRHGAQVAGKEVAAAGDPKASRFLEKVLAAAQPEAMLAFVDGIAGGNNVGGVPPFVAIATKCAQHLGARRLRHHRDCC